MITHPEDIDAIIDQIEAERAITNHEFCEWLRMSFKCPACRPFAAMYQKRIRSRDLKICGVNSPLCE